MRVPSWCIQKMCKNEHKRVDEIIQNNVYNV
jgi:hypothetical protein